MNNSVLADLNFKRLLRYTDGAPQPAFRYAPPLACGGFCISCEQKGLLAAGSGPRLYLMSHGADTSDFESLFGTELPLEHGEKYVETPVVFLLESPRGMKGNGRPRTFKGVEKEPPVCHYYWMPPATPVWPRREDVLAAKNRYGPYFAYILRRFRLKNAYFTNVVKCGLVGEPGHRFIPFGRTALHLSIRDNCCEEFLRKELLAFHPRVVFPFSSRAYHLFRTSGVMRGIRAQVLHHPCAGRTQRHIIDDNDELIERTLAETLP